MQGREIQSLIGDREETLSMIEHADTVTQFTLQMWFLVQSSTKYRLQKELRLIQWIAYDRPLIPSSLDQTYKQWIPSGITAMCTLMKKWEFHEFPGD